MGDLIGTIQKIVENYIKNMGITDMVIGTVTNDNPLEITLVSNMLPIPAEAIILTEAVAEKKIKASGHSHQIKTLSHNHATSDQTTSDYTHTHTVPQHQTEVAIVNNPSPSYQPSEDYYHDLSTHYHDVLQNDTSSNTHNHTYPGRATSDGLTGSYLTEIAEETITSNGGTDESGYAVINRSLRKGDKVIMLRVLNGQNFIVLSRVF